MILDLLGVTPGVTTLMGHTLSSFLNLPLLRITKILKHRVEYTGTLQRLSKYPIWPTEVCTGLRFMSGSRQWVELSARLPTRVLGDFKLLVPTWSRDKNFLSSHGPGPGALLSSPGLFIPAGNLGVTDVEQY